MHDDDVTALLREDLDSLAASFDDDGFARSLQARIAARKRARAGVLSVVGLLGAGVAAAQFNVLLESAKQTVLVDAVLSQGASAASAFAASIIIAAAVISTAIVLQREG